MHTVPSVSHLFSRLFGRRLATFWSRQSLAGRFTIASLAVLGCGMTLLGAWVSSRIEEGVLYNSASSAALYINTFIDPQVQELAKGPNLRPETVAKLDELLNTAPLRRKVVGIKIWSLDTVILYSTKKEEVGRKYPPSWRLQEVMKGRIVGSFDTREAENSLERKLGLPLFEIYTPIRASDTQRIIAIAEFYENGTELKSNLARTRLYSWFVVALVTLLMLSILFRIVRTGSATISSQQKALRERISELSRLLRQNEDLRHRVDEINRRSVETHDLILRRVGAEMHDGPAQLISLALLRLDALQPKAQVSDAELPREDYVRIHSALSDALTEIRNMSAGLILPELDALSPADALWIVVRNHERRTGTTVKCDVSRLPASLSNPLKTCLYRLTQEALSNAFRHGGGVGQSVEGGLCNGRLTVTISDMGRGFPVEEQMLKSNGLGLKGMRDRVAALGGVLEIESKPGGGTRLTAQFELSENQTVSNVERVG
jgi:signal transduction histidine kinase